MRVSLEQAAELLKKGEVVAIPTETVYGLAADAMNEEAISKIYAIKKRPAQNPLIVHIAQVSQVALWVEDFPPLAQKLAKTFWPGPLTLVLKARAEVPTLLRANAPTVAIRIPAHPVAQALLNLCGIGLAAPSANLYTQLSPTQADHVEQSLGCDIPVLDGGPCDVGIESTIVSVEGNRWQLLRQGMISEAMITDCLGYPPERNAVERPIAPGQHLLHYSPKTATVTFTARAPLLAYAQTHPDCTALIFGQGETPSCPYIIMPDEPHAAAERLYASLHQLDQFQKQELLIQLPPNKPEWAAINDRLSRATYGATMVED